MNTSTFADMLVTAYPKMVDIAEIDIETCVIHSHVINDLLGECPGIYVPKEFGVLKFMNYMTRAAFEAFPDEVQREAFLNILADLDFDKYGNKVFWKSRQFLGEHAAKAFNDKAEAMVTRILKEMGEI